MKVLSSSEPASFVWESIVTFDTVISLGLALIAVGAYIRTRWKLRTVTKTQLRMSDDLGKLRLDLSEAEQENKQLANERDEWMPRKWIANADQERAFGNDAIAVDILDQGYQRMRGSLGIVVHQLAEFHASRMIGEDAAFEHESALRLSKIAKSLAPGLENSAALTTDLENIEIVDGEPLQLAASRFDASSPLEAERVISAISKAHKQHYANGRYRICLLFNTRGLHLARRHGLEATPNGLSVRHNLAESMWRSGLVEEALAVVSQLLPVRQRVEGEKAISVLVTHNLLVAILSAAQRDKEALEEVETLLKLFVGVLPDDSDTVLLTRTLKSQVLRKLGKNEDALKCLEEPLHILEAVHGEETIGALQGRTLRADILYEIGEFDEAISELERSIPNHEKALGSFHPQTLHAQVFLARLLYRIGNLERSSRILELALPEQMKALGDKHPAAVKGEELRQLVLAAIHDQSPAN
ncbi:MAG: tetratricopeptide repeat protein [Erythrobacter sp.]|uniref:tetratricopeptide repeat protein n=1 Tax=Erythrobacter sp. TaxID=1042 RepID=UPI00329A4169